jgi:hypothetical protein
MQTLTDFDPSAQGFRVATPITRKARRQSTRSSAAPKYSSAVWWSFQNSKPLEITVKVGSVEDTVRALKRAARYLERTHSKPGSKVEVRVQIAVEQAMEDVDGVLVPRTGYSVAKFLGHKPFLLGRRVSKDRAGIGPATPAATEPASHRRTVAATRATASHRKTALRDPVVRAVITSCSPRCLVSGHGGCGVSGPCIPLESGSFDGCYIVRKPIDFPYLPILSGGAVRQEVRMEYYREYIEITGDRTGPYTTEICLCHDFPVMAPTGSNLVVIFDDAALKMMSDGWTARADMPTESWFLPEAAFMA